MQKNNPDYQKLYTYADGNGNRFVFSWNGFEYFPVTPAISSSGTYDGGTYMKKVPDSDKYFKVVDLIQKAKESKEDHTGKREMMTALINISEKNVTESEFILKAGSKWLTEIETLLKDIRDH